MTKNLDKDLDDLLGDTPLPKAPKHLREAILTKAPQAKGFDLSWAWPFGPLWQPASVMALSLSVGLYMGAILPAQAENEITIYDVEQFVMGEVE